MKLQKRIISVAICILFLIAITIQARGATTLTVDNRNPYEEPILIRATCYTDHEGAITSSGKSVKPGIIAGKKEWQGNIALLYTYKIVDGQPVPDEFIGMYEVTDTGAGIDTDGDGAGDSIINGESIDIYQPTTHAVDEFIDQYGDYVMMLLINGKG